MCTAGTRTWSARPWTWATRISRSPYRTRKAEKCGGETYAGRESTVGGHLLGCHEAGGVVDEGFEDLRQLWDVHFRHAH
jgi:hypothetical protein